MNWLNIFKMYNVKRLKKEKLIILFTMLSILITTTLSIVVPTLSANMNDYNKKSVREANGGDLFVKFYYDSKAFNEETDKLKGEGYKVTYKKIESANFQKNKGHKYYAKLILGEPDIKSNEIILDFSMAKNLHAKVGDKVSIETDEGLNNYIVKEIESIPTGVTSDETLMGYGKVNESKNVKAGAGSLVYISKNTDGEALKRRMKAKEDGYIYSSIKDKDKELKSNTELQLASFGILTTMGYILSSIAIITTSIMLIARRKRDISIMKLVSLRNKDIKNALRAELSIIVLLPVLVSVLATIVISHLILKSKYIPQSTSTIEQLGIYAKGIILNILFFEVFSNLPLLIINDIKGLWILRESEEKDGVIKKRIFVYLLILMPVMLLLYSFYIGSSVNLVTSLGIIIIILLFLIVSAILMKIFTTINYKTRLQMYSFKNMKKNLLICILLIVSFSITLVFMMIALTLNSNVENSTNKSLASVLPYNYMVPNTQDFDSEKVLTKENGVDGYNRVYYSIGKVLNKNIENKAVTIDEVKKEDYKLEVKMVEGEKLFKGQDGCLITSSYQKANGLKIGDILHIYYEDRIIDIKIKGVYDNSVLDSQSILMSYRGYGKDCDFYVKAHGEKWMTKLGDKPVVPLDTIGGDLSTFIGKFTSIFRTLSFMVVFAALIFNINLLNISFIEERKEETVIRALGIGKGFISKVYIFKGSVLTLVSCVLAYGFYITVSWLLFSAMGINSVNFLRYLPVLLLCGLALTVTTFIYPFITMRKYNSYEFLREK